LKISKEYRNDNELIPTTQLGFLNSILSFLKKDKENIHNDKQMFIHSILQSLSNNFINMSNVISKLYKSLDYAIEEKNQEEILKKYVVNDKWVEYTKYNLNNVTLDKVLNKEAYVGLSSQLRVKDNLINLIKKDDHIILTGPIGCGKSMIINQILSNLKSICLIKIDCNPKTTAIELIKKLSNNSVAINSANGKIWKPKEGIKFVLYIRNVNLIEPDKYDTISLIEFLLQILVYKGFYDENLEFVNLERVQLIISMHDPKLKGRNQISTRFTSRMKLLNISNPTDGELN